MAVKSGARTQLSKLVEEVEIRWMLERPYDLLADGQGSVASRA